MFTRCKTKDIFIFGCQRVRELLKPRYINLHITLHYNRRRDRRRDRLRRSIAATIAPCKHPINILIELNWINLNVAKTSVAQTVCRPDISMQRLSWLAAWSITVVSVSTSVIVARLPCRSRSSLRHLVVPSCRSARDRTFAPGHLPPPSSPAPTIADVCLPVWVRVYS